MGKSTIAKSEIRDKTVKDASEYAKKIAGQLKDKGADAIPQFSRRGYPALILADDELWIDLEKEPIANMALSPEESEVLQSARRSEHAFPLFINGRAGSGKSLGFPIWLWYFYPSE